MLSSILSDSYKYEISFLDWLLIGLPVAIFLLPTVWFFLTNISFNVSKKKSNALEITIQEMKGEIGSPSFTEKIVTAVFF